MYIIVYFREHDAAFPSKQITGPASLLSMNLTDTGNDDGIHWLFYGGQGHISVTNSCNILTWDNIDETPWLQPRSDKFDKDGVETGPAPIKLYDGNYLMLYNGYTVTRDEIEMNGMVVPHQKKHYQIGWVILDGNNPRKILQRSDIPLIASTYAYELGHDPYTCAQHDSVYAKSILSLSGIFGAYFTCFYKNTT